MPRTSWAQELQDLQPLAELTTLKQLDLCFTPVSDLTPLVGLTELTIFLAEGQRVEVPKEIQSRVVRVAVVNGMAARRIQQ